LGEGGKGDDRKLVLGVVAAREGSGMI